MNTDATHAVRRAADEWPEAYQRHIRLAPSNRHGQGVSGADVVAARVGTMRDVLAAALNVEEMARVIAYHESWSTYSELGVQCSCGTDLGAIPLSQPAYDIHQAHQAAMIRAAILGEDR
jgi:hypothetical protein